MFSDRVITPGIITPTELFTRKIFRNILYFSQSRHLSSLIMSPTGNQGVTTTDDVRWWHRERTQVQLFQAHVFLNYFFLIFGSVWRGGNCYATVPKCKFALYARRWAW